MITTPFLFVNPKSYLWGKKSLELALHADRLCRETGITVFFTCPYADIRLIAENTNHIIVTAQNMDALTAGRGMGHVLPESLVEAGAKAVVLNHAENTKTLEQLSSTMKRAKELDLLTIICADSTVESRAVAQFQPSVILAEPTELIGTGETADEDYIIACSKAIKEISPATKVMIASGITTGEDCYKVIYNGADGTGSTSGIVNAPSPKKRIEEMLHAIQTAMSDRKAST